MAVAVGSRGITDLAAIVRAAVAHLRSLGLDPFVASAMGSHGGATAEGQRALLAGYDITAEGVGCPVRCEMATVEAGRSAIGVPVHLDRGVVEADHVVLINRIKPHTSLSGSVESGLAKMALVGLGNHDGAAAIHRATFDHAWDDIVEATLPVALSALGVLAGVAIIEDAHDRTALVEAVRGDAIAGREPALLERARGLLPRLPVADLDIILIDRIGKDISGTGFDTNVLGRKRALHRPRPDETPRVGTIIVRSLSPASNGNALGLGLAELCRTRVVDAMDPEVTATNARTSGNLPAAMVPVHLASDRELLEACVARLGWRTLAEARICWIRDTLHLDEVACSATVVDEMRGKPRLKVDGPAWALPFDSRDNLPDLLSRSEEAAAPRPSRGCGR